MPDLYMTDDGNLGIAPSGDLAVTKTPWRDDLQQAYVRCMTDKGDYLLYPELGATLSELKGMPQSEQTGAYGKQLISAALDREGRFINRPYRIQAFPTGPQSIRFDIEIVSGDSSEVSFSVEQDLSSSQDSAEEIIIVEDEDENLEV